MIRLILTAVRRDEAAAVRVGELQLSAGDPKGCWILPAARSKNGRSIRVPLSAPARAIVEAALADRPDASAFIFSTTGLTAVSGWSKAKTRLDRTVDKLRAGRGAEPKWA